MTQFVKQNEKKILSPKWNVNLEAIVYASNVPGGYFLFCGTHSEFQMYRIS